MKRYSVALTATLDQEARTHLIRKDRQEDLCFALWFPSTGQSRQGALIHSLVLPERAERRVRGNAMFTGSYFERAIGLAVKHGSGLALMHSHPYPGWQDMSFDDVRAEEGHAAATKGATGLPLVGLTVGSDGSWSGRFWEKTAPRSYERNWCETVRVVGDELNVTYNDHLLPVPAFRRNLERTVSAWGTMKQGILARLHIGIVGAGSVGSIVAEALARMGVQRITLLDFDTTESVNLDRLLHATEKDAKAKRPKVNVLAKALRKSATAKGFSIEAMQMSVVEEEGFRHSLDCDLLFCCVDRPWPRSVLNLIAHAHLIPVVDAGIRVTRKADGNLRGADWKTHIVGPGRPCLECLGQYDPGLVQAEREGFLDDPHYIDGLPAGHGVKANENVFAFSLGAGSLQVLQMLSMVIAPSGISNVGTQNYHFVTGRMDAGYTTCGPSCPYPDFTALGDRTGIVVTGRHIRAELQRALRRRWWDKLRQWV